MPATTAYPGEEEHFQSMNIEVSFIPVNFKETKESIKDLRTEAERQSGVSMEHIETTNKQTAAVSRMGSSNRMLAWDFMLLGRSIGIANRELGLNNRLISDLAGIMQLVASVMRIMIVSEELMNLATSKTNASLATQAALETATATAGPISMLSSTLAATTAGAILPAAGIPLGSLGALLLGGFQSGGVVPKTGPYLLHEKETVIRAGHPSPNMTNINLNMRTGPISSDVDVDKMVGSITTRLALESRRRGQF